MKPFKLIILEQTFEFVVSHAHEGVRCRINGALILPTLLSLPVISSLDSPPNLSNPLLPITVAGAEGKFD